MAIREEFPPIGDPSYLDGVCDGWEYRITFRGGTLEKTYEMVKTFLKEEGYGDIPLPANAGELLLFKHKRTQISLFSDNGYIHNPIKLFPDNPKFKNVLVLAIYNENEPNHLLRFHNVFKEL
jgi:hypothetical protein